MMRQILIAASLALLTAGAANAAEASRRDKADAERETSELTRKKAPPPAPRPVRTEPDRADPRNHGGPDRNRDRDRDNRPRNDRDHRDDVRPGRDTRDTGWRDDGHDGRGHGWRDDDRDRDWRDHDWRRDDDWRRRGWVYQGWRNDGWRYYRGHDHRHWRYVPPYRYTFDFGYRSGYELAWRDWLAYGRYDRYWRRPGYGYGGGYGYSAGYEAGWRDAAFYYARGYRPDYWAYDPQGGWYFSFGFHVTG